MPARVQLIVTGLKVPVELVAKITLPVGVMGTVEVSFTVAVHVVIVPTTTGEGAQVTDVEVGRVP